MRLLTCPEILDHSFKVLSLVTKYRLVGALLPSKPVRIEWDLLFPNGHIDYHALGLDSIAGTLDAAKRQKLGLKNSLRSS